MVLSLCHSHCESSPVYFTNVEKTIADWLLTLGQSQSTWATSLSVGC